NSGHLPYFLRKLGHIGKFIKIAYPMGLYPFVYGFLCVFYVHYSLFFVSICMVTGPSLSSATFMSAPKIPVPTFLPRSFSNCTTKLSYKGIAISGFAAF